MKSLLDRLMARQMKLLAALDEPPVAARTGEAPRPADPVAEAAARDVAAQHLESGDLRLAREALEPFLESGRDVQTLTTLARVCTDQGDLDQALTALQRAESIDPADRKVWRLMAKLLSTQRRYREEVVYLRRLAFADDTAPAMACINLLKALLRSIDKGKRVASAELKLVLSRFEAANDADDKLRLQFAGLYYILSGGGSDAQRLYDSAMPRSLLERDCTARLLPLTSWCTQHGLPMPRSNAEGMAGRRPTLFQLTNVDVFPSLGWIPVLDNGRVIASGYPMEGRLFRGEGVNSPLMLYRGSHAELRLPREIPVEPGPALLIGGSASDYESALMHAGGLAIVETVGGDRQLPLVVSANISGYQRELIELLGYRDNSLICIADDAPRRFEHLHVPSRLAIGAEWIDPMLIRWYRRRLTDGLRLERRRKLYVTDSRPGGVAAINESAVADLLTSMGYETVDPSTMRLRDQIESFAAATHVVGATCEGLTGLLFSAEDTRLLELRAVHWTASGGRLHFDLLSKAAGQRYDAIECLRAASEDLRSTIIDVDLDALRLALERIA
jgi:hypothetical protein